jgi:hypothetical protein
MSFALERFNLQTMAIGSSRHSKGVSAVKHQYCVDILQGHYIKDIIPIIELTTTRIIARARMNDGKFYCKGEYFILPNSDICSLCNTEDLEDVFHLTITTVEFIAPRTK